MKKCRSLLCVLLAVFLLLSFSACGNGLPASANKTIHYQLPAEPTTLDPQVASDYSALVVIEALFEGLVRLDEKNKPYPGVAESWSHNSDYTQFTFRLRSDAKWANDEGTPVTAKDFVYAFQRALDPATGSTTCQSMYCMKNAQKVHLGVAPLSDLGVKAQDDHTLVVDLEYSYEDFPSLTATAPFMPCNEDFFNQTEGQYCLEARHVLGNGPFAMNNRYSWEHGKSIQLSRFKRYQGEEPVYPSSLNFTIEKYKPEEALSLLLDGKTDAAAIRNTDLEQAKEAELGVTSFQDTTWGLTFNTASEIMKNPAIRKAFVQTLDREKLLQYIPKNTVAANDIITPSTIFMEQSYRDLAGNGFYLKQDDASLAAAKAALPSLELESMPSVTVLCPDDENVKKMVNEMLATWNTKMGNYFNMEPLPQEALEKRVKNGDYDVAVYSIRGRGEGPMQLLSQFQSSSVENPAFLKSPDYDDLLDMAQMKTGSDMLAHFVAAEKYLNDNAIFYPLYYESRYFATAKGVTGVVFHPYDAGIDFIRAGKN